MSASKLHFQDSAWLLLEPKTIFYSPRYRQKSLSVRYQVLPFWNQPQVVLQLGQIEYLVLTFGAADACQRSRDQKETKKLIQVTTRLLDDVKRATLYQTAIQTQVLEIFVYGEETRERLLRCLRGEKSGKKLLDEAFMTLSRAQQSVDKETAIKFYKEAERAFWKAEKVVADARSRELLKERRGDLKRTIRRLEEEEMAKVEERKRYAAAPAAVLASQVKVASLLTTMDINVRLEKLRCFAARQNDAIALQKNSADLGDRLAVLKNEKVGLAMPGDALAERLRKLRGDLGPVVDPRVICDTGFERKSTVDCLMKQVADEISLGIEANDIDANEFVDDSDKLNYGSDLSSTEWHAD